MAELRYTVKDSVFTYLFKQAEYTRQLYLVLHPEDTEVTEADCKIVTLENVLSTGQYNDLGIQVRDLLLLLMEAQSTFSINIVLRLMMYLAETYKKYAVEHKLDLYGSKAVTIPRPELYVVYTGDRQDIPDVLRLSDLYQGPGGAEIEVKVLRGGKEGDILSQYVHFCKIADSSRREYGRGQKAIDETIRRCMEANVLVPFLASRKKEVQDIMVTLFDNQTLSEIHDYNVALRARQQGRQEGMQQGQQKGRKEGRKEGREEGREEGIHAAISMLQGLSIDRETAVQKLAATFDLLPHVAEEKVAQYWVQ